MTTTGPSSTRRSFSDVVEASVNEPGAARWRRRPARRAAVVALVVLDVVLVLSLGAGVLWAALLVALASLPLVGVVNIATRGLFELPSERLDERQRAERAEAHRQAHLLTVWVLVGAFAVAVNLDSTADLGATWAWAGAVGVLVLVSLLPRLVGAWAAREHGELEDGESEDVEA